MSENFAELFEQSVSKVEMRPGALVKATVVKVDSDNVVVSAGLKSDSSIPIEEFRNEKGEVNVTIGDVIDVVVEAVEDGFGETRLSREKAKRAEAWLLLEQAYAAKAPIMGVITERVKGGFTVDINSVRAFLPGSLVDVKPVRDPGGLEGKSFEFKLIKMDRKRNNIVVSRRAVIEQGTTAEGQIILDKLEEGQEVKGTVKNITDYGAFIDLGGVDGLLHITDMSWRRIKHPSEMLNIGDEIKVKVLKIDRDKSRVSLGIKQLGEDPWSNLARRYPVNARLFGRVTNLTDYGCFVEIEEGIEGLVHMSEMDWTNKNVHPSKIVNVGDEVEVMVLEIDEERRRISLGIKQCQPNPWTEFATHHKEGEKVQGKIKSITDFGIFIGLDGEIDGLVHLSDISWTLSGEDAVREYKKGQEVEAVILAIDPERERISLGVKQLQGDPNANYLEQNPKGTEVTGKVEEVDAKRAIIDLGSGVKGFLRAAEYGDSPVKNLADYLQVGQDVTAAIMGVDRKQPMINLSTRNHQQTTTGNKKHSTASEPATSTLGDLLKEHLDSKEGK